LGIIDTLSAGFATVARRPWLISLSLLLDGYLWFGARLSALPFIESAVRSFVLPPAQANGPDLKEQWAMVKEGLLTIGREVNFFSLLAGGPVSVPSLLSRLPPPATSSRQIIIGDAITFWSAVLILSAAGLFLACLYLGLLAQVIRDDRVEIARWLTRVWVHWIRLLIVGIVLLLAALAFLIPVLLMVGLFSLLSPAVGTFMSTVVGLGLLWLGVWIAIHLFFVADAVILGESGPFRAIWNSFQIVVRNFWSAIGLIVLINVVGEGLFLVWSRLAVNTVGTIVGIVGNAYVGAGLAAASLIFYRDRYNMWQESMASAEEKA